MRYYLSLLDSGGTYQYGKYLFKGHNRTSVDKETFDALSNNPLFVSLSVPSDIDTPAVVEPVKPATNPNTGVFSVEDLPVDHRKSSKKKTTPKGE